MSSEAGTEAKIAAAGLNAPRVTPGDVTAKIVRADYHVFPGTTLTACCLILANGFAVLGQSAAASPENFSEEIGRQVAYDDARGKIWQLEGYLLKERLSRAEVKAGD